MSSHPTDAPWRIDLLLRDARVLTLDDDRPRARAVAVHQGRIAAVLDDDLPAGVRADRVVDLAGAAVLPGFADAHNHMTWYGRSLAEIDLTGLRSVGEVDDAVAARAAEMDAAGADPDAWVVGSGYDDVALGGSPHRDRLDRAGGGRPVWLTHRSHHVCCVSSAVLERAGLLDGSVAVPAGGEVVRDADGRPTGVLTEAAQNLAGDLRKPVGVEEMVTALGAASERYAAEGLTHVTEAGIGGGWIGHSPRELAAFAEARRRGLLGVGVEVMPVLDALHDVAGGPGTALDLGMPPAFGDDDLRLGPAKVFLDGALSSRTAALRTDYADRPGRGELADDPDVLVDRIVAAHRGGWRVAAHAIGDRAVDVALDALAAAREADPRPGVRHRIEHAGMVDDATLARMAALGVTPVPQARFLPEIGDSMRAAVGDDRADLLYRDASFRRAGLRVPGSSDRPCVSDGAPLRTVQAMVERTTASGVVLGPDERVDVATALRAVCVDTAWISHAEDRRGRVVPGLRADLVVLGDDPTAVDTARIGAIDVVATLRAGVATHGAGSLGG